MFKYAKGQELVAIHTSVFPKIKIKAIIPELDEYIVWTGHARLAMKADVVDNNYAPEKDNV